MFEWSTATYVAIGEGLFLAGCFWLIAYQWRLIVRLKTSVGAVKMVLRFPGDRTEVHYTPIGHVPILRKAVITEIRTNPLLAVDFYEPTLKGPFAWTSLSHTANDPAGAMIIDWHARMIKECWTRPVPKPSPKLPPPLTGTDAK